LICFVDMLVYERFARNGLVGLENVNFGSSVLDGFSDVSEGLEKVTALFSIILRDFLEAIKELKKFILT
jgi:hypothetical protein